IRILLSFTLLWIERKEFTKSQIVFSFNDTKLYFLILSFVSRWRGYFIRAHFKILFTIIYLHLLFLPFIVARIANPRELVNQAKSETSLSGDYKI
ncbi:MAG: hypothetical protein PF487_09230, partial [Bacteroidales bacterium]|nr:hypothetical protein [Bacteroidales bacterium]